MAGVSAWAVSEAPAGRKEPYLQQLRARPSARPSGRLEAPWTPVWRGCSARPEIHKCWVLAIPGSVEYRGSGEQEGRNHH